MLFVDPLFLFIFLPILLMVIWAMVRFVGSQSIIPILIAASLIFYSAWSFYYLTMLLGLILLNYRIAKRMASASHRKYRIFILSSALLGHLSVLFYFKYVGFVAELLAAPMPFSIVLPLAISFYTFQQISFLVDVYRKEIEIPPPSHYALYILLFPQLIAGPIVKYPQMQHQFIALEQGRYLPNWSLGLSYIAIGLAKKWLFADTLAPMADSAFYYASIGEQINVLFAWIGLLSYSFQLYFDFSAYGDIAIGLGLLIGLQFPKNFDSPYKATNISDHWRRWHITLGAFLKQYLFIPLGGSKASYLVTCRNIMIVMVLGGIWHGAGLGFILWGAMHGLALIIYHSTKHIMPVNKYLKYCFTIITFLFVTLAWVPFKGVTIDTTLTMYNSLFSLPDAPLLNLLQDMSNTYAIQNVVSNTFMVSLCFFVVWGFNNSHVWAPRLSKTLRISAAYLLSTSLLMRVPIASVIGVLAAVSLKWASGQPTEAFLYFQF